jgi:hypothetical protein
VPVFLRGRFFGSVRASWSSCRRAKFSFFCSRFLQLPRSVTRFGFHFRAPSPVLVPLVDWRRIRQGGARFTCRGFILACACVRFFVFFWAGHCARQDFSLHSCLRRLAPLVTSAPNLFLTADFLLLLGGSCFVQGCAGRFSASRACSRSRVLVRATRRLLAAVSSVALSFFDGRLDLVF